MISVECLYLSQLAPEVIRGEAATQASDVYSLSLVLWEIISGAIPYSYCATKEQVRAQVRLTLLIFNNNFPINLPWLSVITDFT